MRLLVSGDYNAFADGFNAAGVYMISGVAPSSTFERPIYIGSAHNLKRRINSHLSSLRSGSHANPPLQSYYCKHGQYALVIYAVELCEPDKALELEQYHLEKERPFAGDFRGFNIAKDALSPMKGRKDTAETRKLKSEAHRGKARVVENCRKQGEAQAKSYTFVSPEGTKVSFKNLSAFCRTNGLPLTGMVKLSKGKGNSCKGWRRA